MELPAKNDIQIKESFDPNRLCLIITDFYDGMYFSENVINSQSMIILDFKYFNE
jgi:hypothetical protein